MEVCETSLLSMEGDRHIDLSALYFWIQLTDRPSLARADLGTARGWGHDPARSLLGALTAVRRAEEPRVYYNVLRPRNGRESPSYPSYDAWVASCRQAYVIFCCTVKLVRDFLAFSLGRRRFGGSAVFFNDRCRAISRFLENRFQPASTGARRYVVSK